MNPHPPPQTLPQTPLQQALQQPGAAELQRLHRLRLLQLERACRQQLQSAQPPAQHGAWCDRLAMCETALRVLDTLVPAETPALPTARGPAAAWLPPTL